MKTHKSKSGPVKVVKRFTPEPASPAQEQARLRHKLALIEDRIADRQAYNASHRNIHIKLDELLEKRDATLKEIASFGET